MSAASEGGMAAGLTTAHLVDAETCFILGAWEAEPHEVISILTGLEETDFTHPACAEAVRAIRACMARGERPTRLAVRRHLARAGLAELWDVLRRAQEELTVVTGAEIRPAGQEVRLAAARARARRALRVLDAELDNADFTPESWRAKAGQALGKLGFAGRGRAEHVSDLLRKLGQNLQGGATSRDHVQTPGAR